MANNSIPRTDRKLVERSRRNEMKSLFETLNSLLPAHQTSKEAESVPDQVENATNYITELQRKVEKLKEKRDQKLREIGKPKSSSLVQVEVHQEGSSMEFLLTTGPDYHSIFTQILRLLQQNGAQILSVNQSMFADRVLHKIVAQVIGEEGMATGDTDGERICEKVKKFVSEYKDGEYNP